MELANKTLFQEIASNLAVWMASRRDFLKKSIGALFSFSIEGPIKKLPEQSDRITEALSLLDEYSTNGCSTYQFFAVVQEAAKYKIGSITSSQLSEIHECAIMGDLGFDETFDLELKLRDLNLTKEELPKLRVSLGKDNRRWAKDDEEFLDSEGLFGSDVESFARLEKLNESSATELQRRAEYFRNAHEQNLTNCKKICDAYGIDYKTSVDNNFKEAVREYEEKQNRQIYPGYQPDYRFLSDVGSIKGVPRIDGNLLNIF